jgi:hypothetical protein
MKASKPDLTRVADLFNPKAEACGWRAGGIGRYRGPRAWW